jgi:hypothetical protein
MGDLVTYEDLVILVPMLGRREQVRPLLASIEASTPGCRVLFLVTPNDAEVISELTRLGQEQHTVPRRPRGDYARKINTGYRISREPWIFTGAIDLRFHPGWFEAAIAKMSDTIGVVGTNDMGNPMVIAGLHATHFLVARWYANIGTIDEPCSIFCEQYAHEFVDNELIATARHRGAYAHAGDALVEHMHPHWGKGADDLLYQQQPSRMRIGVKIFRRRAHLWES